MWSNSIRKRSEPPHGAPPPVRPTLPAFVVGCSATLVPRIEEPEDYPYYDIDNRGVSAKSGVSWVDMGRAIGAYFASMHPRGSPPVRVAWFPAPG